MLFYLQSTDTDNYGTVKFYANPPLGKDPLLFRINQVNTVAAFMITTSEDYIEFEIGGATPEGQPATQTKKVYFEDRSSYDKDDLPNIITKLTTSVGITVAYNNSNTFTISSTQPFTITDCSHRVKLLLGLYHMTLPLSSEGNSLVAKSVPYNCYGNCLYLRSRLSSIVGLNDKDNRDIYLSLCYNISEMFIPGVPIITRFPGNCTKINPSDLTNIEFTLVDFMNVPVVLKAPLRIVMEVFHLD